MWRDGRGLICKGLIGLVRGNQRGNVERPVIVRRDGNGVLWCGEEEELLVAAIGPVFA